MNGINNDQNIFQVYFELAWEEIFKSFCYSKGKYRSKWAWRISPPYFSPTADPATEIFGYRKFLPPKILATEVIHHRAVHYRKISLTNSFTTEEFHHRAFHHRADFGHRISVIIRQLVPCNLVLSNLVPCNFVSRDVSK